MYGDTAVIRRLAGQMREQAADLRIEADRLVGSVDAVAWNGGAAEAMRGAMRDFAVRLRAAANEHDDAAEALDAHAAEVDRLKALIAAIEARTRSMIAEAKDRIASAANAVANGLRALASDSFDDVLARFQPPPSGHKAWLNDDVPGA
ncbi:hypothetical protein [Nocardioides aurantiacus]|uniref:Uncharacterized protein n=1 Tax=Nocardioides aurantiacus TaxID=86796 RepID=A0A3N2CTV1_9ACTN|nr:hypothetical protein [Nocardioides aurantiacus]ROR90969.1 hypothetical protein EDD33_1826 [Nocardioides aurantiacus]